MRGVAVATAAAAATAAAVHLVMQRARPASQFQIPRRAHACMPCHPLCRPYKKIAQSEEPKKRKSVLLGK